MDGNGKISERPNFEKSRERLIIEKALREADVGDVVTYESLSKAIGRDVREFCMGALTGARKTLLKDDRYVFSAIANTGLKRLNDSEIVSDSENDFAKQRRAAGRSMRKLASVEYDNLSKDDQLRHCAFATQAAVIRELASSKATKRIVGKVEENGSQLPLGKTLELFK